MKGRRVIHGRKWAHLAPPTYTEVMREAGDNDAIEGPSQPAAEHTASESSLPAGLRLQIAYEARASGVVEIDYDERDADDELGERAYTAVYEAFPTHINVDDVEVTYERPS